MASRFWVPGGDGNWGSTNNWSATSGGASGASVPGASDDVYFDGNSGNGTCTLNASARSCLSFNSVNSTNNTLAGSQQLTIGAGGLTFGTLFNVTATGLLTTSTTGCTFTFNGKTWPGTFTAGGSGITVNFADTVRVTGLVFLGVGIGATKTIAGAGKIICDGGLAWSNPASGLVNCTLTGGVEVTAGTVSSGGNVRLAVANTLNISGNVTFSGTNNISGILTQSAGTITWASTPRLSAGAALTMTIITSFDAELICGANVTVQFNGTIPWSASAKLTAAGSSSNPCHFRSSTGGVQAVQTFVPGMVINLVWCNITDIDASPGQALYVGNGTITNCENVQSAMPYTMPFDPLGSEGLPPTIFMR